MEKKDIKNLISDLHKNKDNPEIIENILIEFQDTHAEDLEYIPE
jgi:hypothetical protein